jgi:hypothetical protein
VLGALPLSACKADGVRAEQARLLALTEHIDRLRRADNPDKRALLERLSAAPCEGAEACGLKDLCVRAYQTHQRALDGIAALKTAAERDPAPPSPELRAELARTERELDQAKTLTESCAEEQVRAVRKVLL